MLWSNGCIYCTQIHVFYIFLINNHQTIFCPEVKSVIDPTKTRVVPSSSCEVCNGNWIIN